MAIATEWAQLDPGVPPLTVQPDQDWVYSTLPTIVYVDPTPITINDTLLGIPIQIRATPTTYTWTWGDGKTTTTTDPGTPYPNQTVSHEYLYVTGNVDLTLQTTWTGTYSINGNTWTTINGTITSTSTPRTLTVYSPHSHLVNCDLNGHCLNK
ncbi:hypothetical protein [Demequina capsici]|uniref:PKD domain-containing protein n=1 Tax=Demequina capsici TaxID=3075620 RepID=A0AA96F8Q3_9MICO|nr:hypothetical protein [Demequina sp. OYTSA14]WNM23780.1 hypothetical protein RN606_10460 [Demequina sp. OYTSA14]